ncbi:MAG TPA: flagellar biosynthetic protein FliR [Anaeromyxobacteraceae bacterium]|nr:flagellar biosynthetic protein FliR [Anaeromyxobacteraceae bacterium]
MTLPLASAFAFLLVLLRTTGLFLSAPVLSARVVPARPRLALALLVAFAVYCGVGAPAVRAPEHLGALSLAAAAEGALGLLAGLSARFTLLAALSAGHAASISMGVGYGALLDPSSGAESNSAGELLYTVAQAGAVALGIHREAFAYLARSVAAFPPGGPLSLHELAARVVWDGTMAAALGARLALPMLSAVLVGHVVMAVLGRSASQLNLRTLGFSVAILAGGGAFYLVAPPAAEMAARAALQTLAR